MMIHCVFSAMFSSLLGIWCGTVKYQQHCDSFAIKDLARDLGFLIVCLLAR